jgi:hypothetical protein
MKRGERMRFCRIALALALLMGYGGVCDSWADILSKFQLYGVISTEFNDNIDLTADNEEEDFITTVRPGIRFSNMTETSGIDLDYSLGAVFYHDNTDLNYTSHNASLNAHYEKNKRLKMNFRDYFVRSDEPQNRSDLGESLDYPYGESAVNNGREIYWRNVAAPTVEYQLGPLSRTGVAYRNNLYQTDDTYSEDSREDFLNPFVYYGIDPQNEIYAAFGLTTGDFEKNPDLNGYNIDSRFTHRFSTKVSAFGSYAYVNRDYNAPSTRDYDVHEPSVGLTYTPAPTWNASVRCGYFWQNPENNSKESGFSYSGDITKTALHTTYRASLEGGYKENLFTDENLGFNRYHAFSLSVNHLLDKRTALGCRGRVLQETFDSINREDTTWNIRGSISHTLLKWLVLALEASHEESASDVDINDYKENRCLFSIRMTY